MKEKLKRNAPTKWLQLLKSIKSIIFKVLMMFMRLFPIKKNKVTATSFYGKSYGGNPKYIVEELLGNNKEIIWLVENYDNSIPKVIKQVKYRGLTSIYHLATSRLWIDDSRKYSFVSKREGQFYLQTWHGSIPLKKIEKDAEATLNIEYVRHAKNDSKMIDLMISDNILSDNVYSKSFWYSGRVLRSGMPKLDILYGNKEKLKERITNVLGIASNTKLILYAPTFRNETDTSFLDLDYQRIINSLEEKSDNKFCLILRLHPNLKGVVTHGLGCSRVFDVTDYPDVYELMLISDILITDYSSLMFEFPIASDKPVFLYANDAETYDRGYYFDPRELPFKFSTSNDELISEIRNFDEEKYKEKLSIFYRNLGFEGTEKSGKYVAKYIDENVFNH